MRTAVAIIALSYVVSLGLNKSWFIDLMLLTSLILALGQDIRDLLTTNKQEK